MVMPTTLKKRHSLKGLSLLPAIRKLQDEEAVTSLKGLARVSVGRQTEDLPFKEVAKQVADLTGEQLGELLSLAGKGETDLPSGRLLLHFLIILANERGQPLGQDLVHEEAGTSTSTRDGQEPTDHVKRRRVESTQSEGTKLERIPKDPKDKVKEMRELLRSSATQQDPSEQLILWNLDRLVKVARKYNHEETDIYEELAMQASRYQGKLDIASLCLTVLGGQSTDVVAKAIGKCLRERKSEDGETKMSKSDSNVGAGLESSKNSVMSPLSNLYPSMFPLGAMNLGYPPFQGQAMVPQFQGAYQSMMQPHMGQFNFRSRGAYKPFGRGYQRRQRGTCWFCESVDHLVKDCPRMKAAKAK